MSLSSDRNSRKVVSLCWKMQNIVSFGILCFDCRGWKMLHKSKWPISNWLSEYREKKKSSFLFILVPGVLSWTDAFLSSTHLKLKLCSYSRVVLRCRQVPDEVDDAVRYLDVSNNSIRSVCPQCNKNLIPISQVFGDETRPGVDLAINWCEKEPQGIPACCEPLPTRMMLFHYFLCLFSFFPQWHCANHTEVIPQSRRTEPVTQPDWFPSASGILEHVQPVQLGSESQSNRRYQVHVSSSSSLHLGQTLLRLESGIVLTFFKVRYMYTAKPSCKLPIVVAMFQVVCWGGSPSRLSSDRQSPGTYERGWLREPE